MSQNLLLIVASIVLGAIVLYFLFTSTSPSSSSTSKKSKKDIKPTSIVLYGPTSSGKTSLATKLLTNEFLPCYASQLVNEVQIQLSSHDEAPRTLPLIDVPGAKVVRDTSQLSKAKVVLFLVDAFTFQVETAAVILYELLSHRAIIANHTPILILCNKADMMLLTKAFIKKKLEKEMQRLWMARKNETMDSIVGEQGDDAAGEESSQTLLLKSLDDIFSFEETCQNAVEFVEVSVKAGKNMDIVKEWILERM